MYSGHLTGPGMGCTFFSTLGLTACHDWVGSRGKGPLMLHRPLSGMASVVCVLVSAWAWLDAWGRVFTPSSTKEAGDLCSLLARSQQFASSVPTYTVVGTIFWGCCLCPPGKGLRFSALICAVLQESCSFKQSQFFSIYPEYLTLVLEFLLYPWL